MSKVICISDSEESGHSTAAEEANNYRGSDEDSEFNYPAVEFYYEIDKREKDEYEEDDCEENGPKADKPKKDDCEVDKTEENDLEVDELQVHKTSNAKKKRNIKNVDAPPAQKKQKTIKPGDGLKTIKVCLDDGLISKGFAVYITEALESFDISWSIDELPIADSIKFVTRNECGVQVNQKHILIIWNWDEAVDRVKNNTFESRLERLFELEANPKVMLVLCGIEEYFRAKKGDKQSTKRSKNAGSVSFHDAPKITRHELEMCLFRVQLNLNCSCQIIDTPEALGPLVYRFTKSVAQIPYKQQQREKIEQKLDWYANGDNRDTVRVDGSGNGLSRLWQQQLCQFTLARLETAEAISAIYPSPLQLMTAYQKCTKTEGEKLLKDIPIRRAAGPLSTIRKIGPELSKKIFIMFTSKDGEATVGN